MRVPRQKLLALAKMIGNAETGRRCRAQANLVFVSDRKMRILNRDYRKKDTTTDVLSFCIDDVAANDTIFGEIYISVEQARRQATGYGATLNEEIVRLTCHGLLHLFGYDHKRKAETVLMQEKEQLYLNRLVGSR
ncbi:MAG: rRNA maturation RNase YbeY [candidate division Zixibacteria bacterium]|nr:rRNA maturation RNase YbeY [candidate division Zixibacteria bacterium]